MNINECTNYELAERYLDETYGEGWYWRVEPNDVRQDSVEGHILTLLNEDPFLKNGWDKHGIFSLSNYTAYMEYGIQPPTHAFREMIKRRRKNDISGKEDPWTRAQYMIFRASCPSFVSDSSSNFRRVFNKEEPITIEFEDGWRANYSSLSDIPVGVKYKVIV